MTEPTEPALSASSLALGERASDPPPGAREPGLEENRVSLIQSTVFDIANTAPTNTLALAMVALLVASAGGAAGAILITTLPTLAIAWSFARLNRWDPRCGASYVWIGRIFGPMIGFGIGWVVLACNVIGTAGTVLPAGPTFLAVLGLDPTSRGGTVLFGTLLVILVMVIAIVGITLTARTQMLVAGVEFGIVIVFMAIGMWKTFIAHPAGFVHPSWSWLSPVGVGSHGALTSSLLLAVFFVAGWDASFYVNEETQDRHRNPGRAVIACIVCMAIFFALASIAFQGVASLHQLNEHQAAGLSYVGSRLAGGTGARFLSIAVLLGTAATIQTGMIIVSRLTYAMGNDQLLPRRFAEINERFRTPVFGTVIAAVTMIGIMVGSTYIGSVGSAFGSVVSTVGVLFIIYYTATGLASSWHYRRTWSAGGRERLAVALPVLAAGFLTWVCVKSIIGFSPGARWVLVGIAAIGAVAMASAKWVHHSPYFTIQREPGLVAGAELDEL